MLAAFALVGLTSLQGSPLDADARLDKHVTFRTPAARIGAVLEGLSKATGLTLKAPAVIGSEVVLLRLNDVPLRETMKRLATACGGVWTKEKDIYYLGRSADWDRKQEERLRAERLASLKKQLAKEADYAAKLTPLDATGADEIIQKIKSAAAKLPPNQSWSPQLAQVMALGPKERAGTRMMSLLDAESLANLSLSRRSVYASTATQMEHPLSLDFTRAFDSYVAEQSVWVDRAAVNGVGLSPGVQAQLSASNKETRRPAKVLVIANSGELGNSLEVEIKVIDSEGDVLVSTFQDFQFDSDPGNLKDLDVVAGEQRLELDPENRVVLQNLLAKFSAVKVQPLPLTPAVITRLKRPDLNDPLGGFVSQFMLEAADKRNLNVVADVPDVYFMLLGVAATAGMPTPRGVLSIIQQFPGLNPVKFEGSWVEIDGAEINGFYAHRTDRPALTDLLGAWDAGAFPIEALARYAFRTGARTDDMLVVLLGRIMSDSMADPNDPSWQTLNLLGALVSQFGDQVVHQPTTTVPVNRLNADSINVLNSVVYSKSFERTYTMAGPPRPAGSRSEPNNVPEELFPNGVPGNGEIQVTAATTPVVLMHLAGQQDHETTPGGVARMMDERDHPESYPGIQRVSDVGTATFKQGTSIKVNVTLALAGVFHPMGQVVQHQVSGDSVSYDQLPEAFKAEIKASLARFDLQRKHQ